MSHLNMKLTNINMKEKVKRLSSPTYSGDFFTEKEKNILNNLTLSKTSSIGFSNMTGSYVYCDEGGDQIREQGGSYEKFKVLYQTRTWYALHEITGSKDKPVYENMRMYFKLKKEVPNWIGWNIEREKEVFATLKKDRLENYSFLKDEEIK